MTREEAKRIATGLRTDFKCESDTMVDFCNTVIEALEQQPKWIPCSERLPEKNRKYNIFLVTDSNGNLSISKFYLPLSNSDIDQPYWSGMIDVIAWMPLPEPYKMSENPTDSKDVIWHDRRNYSEIVV